ncbi:MAG: adenylyltransferase/cytidyltransferase family protein [Bdellovibrionales bacterium]
MTTVITYGTFDIFHIGHLHLLERAKKLGDKLIVGVSTDKFNVLKNKRSFMPYAHRSKIVASIKFVDKVIPENTWEQKIGDIKKYGVDVFCIGNDWKGKFDFLKDHCKVVYLKRTDGIDSTSLRTLARAFDKESLQRLSDAHAIIDGLLKQFDGK